MIRFILAELGPLVEAVLVSSRSVDEEASELEDLPRPLRRRSLSRLRRRLLELLYR